MSSKRLTYELFTFACFFTIPPCHHEQAAPSLTAWQQSTVGFSSGHLLSADIIDARYRCAVGKILIKQSPPGEGLRNIMFYTGTAFFINGTGDMLTAAHVLLHPLPEGQVETRFLILADGSAVPMPPFAEDERVPVAASDISLLHLKIQSPCYIPYASSKASSIDEEVFTLGYPNSSSDYVEHKGDLHQRATFQHGKLIKREYDARGIEGLQVRLFADFGMSGSPIINASGQAIAVVSSKEHLGNSFVYAVPIELALPIASAQISR